ncbi:MAG: tripartite tricarboxylate transporter substrate binding protein, partial [Ramlibacter sp.]|nr:tripartite tricarboxylate transporter substrate binding protein [Ramlibacter sp.]
MMRNFLNTLSRARFRALILLAFLPGLAAAQAWPNRPVRLIVPLLAGGSVDQTARFFATELGKAFGQPFVVENLPGANGVIGLGKLAQSAPDGYTLGVTANSFHTISPHLTETPLPYDAIKDFTPVAGLVSVAHIVLARPNFPASTVPELVALAKATPTGLNHGSASQSGASYLASVLFRRQAGVKFTDVFYKGAGGVYTDLMGGHIDIFFDSVGASIPLIAAGKVKVIATTGEKRHPLSP